MQDTTLEFVPLADLTVADDNVRTGPGDVTELAASIKAQGLIEPLVATPEGLIVAGSRRLAAALEAGLKTVPVVRRSFTEQERLEAMLVENLQREDLSPLEEASAYKRLSDEFGLSQRAIAARVGCAQAQVSKRLALLELPEPVQKQVDEGTVSLTDAYELGKVKDDPKLVESIAKKATPGDPMAVVRQVKQEVDKRDQAKKHAAKMKELRAAGETVVDLDVDKYGWNIEAPEGMALVHQSRFVKTGVFMEEAKHRKLKCHAVGVNPRTLDVVEVCTDPTHKRPAEAADTEAAKREAAAEAEKQKQTEATERRTRFLQGEAKVKIASEVLLELALVGLMTESYDDDVDELACGLLGLTAPEPTKTEGDEGDEEQEGVEVDEPYPIDLLRAEAAKGVKDAHRVAFALAAARVESNLSPWGDWSQYEAYFAWLAKRGYKASTYEKAMLGTK